MRYIRIKTVTKRIFDDYIKDVHDIKSIIETLKNHEITCAIRLNSSPLHDVVRIIDTDEDLFSFNVIRNRSCLLKKSLYSEIDYLKVNTEDSVIVRTKPNVSRWSLLDPSNEDIEES